MKTRALQWLERMASVKLTLVCILLAMALVLFGTLAQVHMGTFEAQKVFFNRCWIYADVAGFSFPIFPGGLMVGSLWMINLIAAFFTHFSFKRRDTGILISHFGVILLLLGQLLTQLWAHESNMPIEIGQTRQFSESTRDMELALIRTSDPARDEVTSIPESRFRHAGPIVLPGRPVSLVVRQYFQNAQLGMGEMGKGASMATQGIGTRVSVVPAPSVSSDDDSNTVTAFVEVLEEGRSLGVWLLSSGLGAPQSFTAKGEPYEIYIRHKRHYFPFRLTLKEFHHDIYPGTDIPKNFSSLVQLWDARSQENRQALIYMNHPLRYDGKTFYQASFGKGDQLSVFQVVENPAAWVPYVSCSLVILGLLIQFLWHLVEFVRKKR